MNPSKINTPEDFFNSIPTDLGGNLAYRKELSNLLAKDKGFQDTFLSMCLQCPEISFNTMFWTFDPRKDPGYRNQPFILRPKQVTGIRSLKQHSIEKRDLLFDKSREEGASEIICGYIANSLLLDPEFYGLVGSRVESLVDDATIEIRDGKLYGPHIPLFHKILYKLVNLPPWAFERFKINKWIKKFKFLQNPFTGSAIQGEATTKSFGAGGRSTITFIDELAQIEPDIAQALIDTIHDVSPVCIYNSTHGPWGSGHPYARMIVDNKIDVVELDWSDNPVKAKGLYTSPDLNVIEIVDIDYYKNKWPEIFKDFEANKPFKFSDFETELLTNFPDVKGLRFVADGGAETYGAPRSPWLDYEILDRERSKTYIARYILRVPQASADQVFEPESLQRIKHNYIRDPDFNGEINFETLKENERLTISNIKFQQSGSKSRFKWWGELPKGRPNQTHNYVVACDISRGTGASNSVCQVFDVNTYEQVGEWADPYLDVTDFAEQVLALCMWTGGASGSPYLIWEANGPGDTFEKRILKYGYSKMYTRTDERSKTRKRKKQYGWWSSAGQNGTKLLLLGQLDSALQESVKAKKNHFYIIVHSRGLWNELTNYMFGEGRMDANISTCVDESTGARYAHGDRVIPAALVCLAVKEQPKAVLERVKEFKPGSFGYRFQQWKKEEDEKARKYRRFTF